MNMIALLLAATLSAGNAEFDATARDGARDISLSRAREELREKGPAPGALEKAMLADPKKFEKPDEAETLCRDIFADELRAQFAEKARAIAERLGIEPDKVELDAGKVDEIASKHFGSAFASERKAAVETQAKTIVTATPRRKRNLTRRKTGNFASRCRSASLTSRRQSSSPRTASLSASAWWSPS